MSEQTAKEILHKYIPAAAVDSCIDWLNKYQLLLTIKKKRTTKIGDFRPAYQNKPARISVNGDLNKFSFLITLVHEIAHAVCWQQHRNQVKPHGKEWKNIYRGFLTNCVELNVFPESVEQSVVAHLNNPKAASCSDSQLIKTLRQYDTKKSTYLEDLPLDALFALRGGKKFMKKEQKRKRFHCLELSTNKIYLIHPLAEVIPIEK